MYNYDDIIDLPHHISKKRPQMSMVSRAAQFASFKALTGFDDEIDEASRITDKKPEPDEEQQSKLNQVLLLLEEISTEQPLITVTYFIPDAQKSGGKYATVKGHFRVIDFDVLKFTDVKEVLIKNIIDINFG